MKETKVPLAVAIRIFFILIVYLIGAAVLYICRALPVAKIWTNYNVVYVEKSVEEDVVLSFMNECGVQNVVSKGAQKVMEITMALPMFFEDKSDYLERRLEYFSDRSGEYSLYYVPSFYEQGTEKAVANLIKATKCDAGMDERQAFPWAVPVMCIVSFILLLFICSRKDVFFFASLFAVMLSFSNPTYPLAAGIILFMGSVFVASGLWGRKHALRVVLSNPVVDLLLLSSMTVVFVNSWKSGLLMLMVSAMACVVLILVRKIQELLETRRSFTFERIFTANSFVLVNRKIISVVGLLSLPVAVVFLLFMFQATFSPKSSGIGLVIPSPVYEGDESLSPEEMLPDLNDFYAWAFSRYASPYRKLDDVDDYVKPKFGDKVTENVYESTDEGIVAREETVLEFNEKFQKQMDNEIKSFDYPSIERFLDVQDKNIKVAFSGTANVKVENDTLSMLLIMVCMILPLLLVCGYLLVGRNRR